MREKGMCLSMRAKERVASNAVRTIEYGDSEKRFRCT